MGGVRTIPLSPKVSLALGIATRFSTPSSVEVHGKIIWMGRLQMSITNVNADPSWRGYVEGIAQSAVFSAFHNVIIQRKDEGYTKADIADRMGMDRAAFTKLTSNPSNMKINTLAVMAASLDVEMVFVLIDRNNRGVVYTSIGTYTASSSVKNIAGFDGSYIQTNMSIDASHVNIATQSINHSTAISPRTVP